jgi:hypothetical protein
LRPNWFEESFKNIIINEDNSAAMRVIGEFISIIQYDWFRNWNYESIWIKSSNFNINCISISLFQ